MSLRMVFSWVAEWALTTSAHHGDAKSKEPSGIWLDRSCSDCSWVACNTNIDRYSSDGALLVRYLFTGSNFFEINRYEKDVACFGAGGSLLSAGSVN